MNDTNNLDIGDLKNLKTIFDLFWPEMIKDYVNDGELDNIEYLRSLIRINDWLEHEVNNITTYNYA